MRRSEILDFAYVGLGIHEQLVPYVADQLDYYADEGVHVAVRDGRGWDIHRLRRGAVVGLGRTQVSRLRDGHPWVMLCVNTDRPLFWLMARPEYERVAELSGRRVAVHPLHSAPGCWTRIVLRRHGLDPDRDVEAIPMNPGDYRSHLRLLRRGVIDAAVIGSTISPEVVAREDRLRVLAFFGDDFQVPTTGVAVDPTTVPLDSFAVRRLVRANLRALRVIVDEPDVAVHYIRRLIPALDDGEVRGYYERYVAPYFNGDGQADPAIVSQALPILARELGVVNIPGFNELYRTDLAAAWAL